MSSLIGSLVDRASAPSGGPPVPLGARTSFAIPGLLDGWQSDEQNMRAYKTQGTVHSNVYLLASSIAKQQWGLYEKTKTDGRSRFTKNDQGSDQRRQIANHPVLNLLAKPASVVYPDGYEHVFWTRTLLMTLASIYLNTTGKFHWIVQRDPRSPIPLGLWPVRPDRMLPVPDPETFMKGWVYTSPDRGERIPLMPNEVIYGRRPDPLDLYGGCGPIGSVLTEIEGDRSAGQWNRNYFDNSAEPGGVIEVDHEVDDDEWSDLMSRWRESHQGVARTSRVAVLEAGQKWVPNERTIKDMDFANLRSTSHDFIREAMAMHKVMTGVTDDVNRANAQTGEEVFSNWKVDPGLGEFREILNVQLLPMYGSTTTGLELDYSYPTPTNREQDNAELTAKAKAFAALVDAGADPDDAADVVGLPRMRMAEKATQQPALPPGWMPPGTSAQGAPALPPGAGTQDVWLQMRQLAAWNRAGAR